MRVYLTRVHAADEMGEEDSADCTDEDDDSADDSDEPKDESAHTEDSAQADSDEDQHAELHGQTDPRSGARQPGIPSSKRARHWP